MSFARQLLDAWEKGLSQSSVNKSLTLLSLAYPDVTLSQLASLNLGERDKGLLRLREMLFGPELNCSLCCPSCLSKLEMSFPVEFFNAKTRNQSNEPYLFSSDGFEVTFHLPRISDLQSLDARLDADQNLRNLLKACVQTVKKNSRETVTEELSIDIVRAISERLSELDPQGDVHIDLICPACSHRWQEAFDIASFLWEEVHVWALRLLREVHILASAYSWSESDILNLSPWRRSAYLELVGQ